MDKADKNKREGTIKSNICYAISAFLVIISIVYVYLGYFSYKSDKYLDVRDGFNRILDEVPKAMGWFLPQWAGLIWFVIDCIVILAIIYVIDQLFIRAKKYRHGIKRIDY